jgi:hypothetical protein
MRKKGKIQRSPHRIGFLPRDRASLYPIAAGRPKTSSRKIISFNINLNIYL